MASWAEDLVYGAVTRGVNQPTFAALNLVLLLAVLSLALLLIASIYSNPALVPHVAFLLFLAVGLWASIVWLVGNLGLTDSAEQRKELFGEEQQQDEAGDQKQQAEAAEPKKEQ